MNSKKGLIAFFCIVSIRSWSANYSVNIEVSGYNALKGNIVIALLDTKESYLSSKSDPFKYIYLPVTEKKVICSFHDISEGEYTIKLYHDENNNNKLDTYFGIPTEKYGFSNNARGKFGIPSYGKAMFSVSDDVTQKIVIK
ncbi:MAG: DUF2141 domain-containing protein [Cyclobacteriaceae bacterium]